MIWEEIPPDLAEITKRRDTRVGADFPHRVAIIKVKVIGYSYASAYCSRTGYRFTFESSIYISETERRCGTGQLLLSDLIRIVKAQDYHQLIT